METKATSNKPQIIIGQHNKWGRKLENQLKGCVDGKSSKAPFAPGVGIRVCVGGGLLGWVWGLIIVKGLTAIKEKWLGLDRNENTHHKLGLPRQHHGADKYLIATFEGAFNRDERAKIKWALASIPDDPWRVRNSDLCTFLLTNLKPNASAWFELFLLGWTHLSWILFDLSQNKGRKIFLRRW